MTATSIVQHRIKSHDNQATVANRIGHQTTTEHLLITANQKDDDVS